MNGSRHEAVRLVEREHHGADHDGILQLHGRALGGHALRLATRHEGADVAAGHLGRVHDLDARREFHALLLGDVGDLLRVAEQHALGNPACGDDRRRCDGTRLAALGQDDALHALARGLDEAVAEGGRRQPRHPGLLREATGPRRVDPVGHVVHRAFHPHAVIHGDAGVHAVEARDRAVRPVLQAQQRHARLERLLAERQHVGRGLEPGGQHDAGQRCPVLDRQRGGQEDVVPVAGREDQRAGPHHPEREGHGAGTDGHVADALDVGTPM